MENVVKSEPRLITQSGWLCWKHFSRTPSQVLKRSDASVTTFPSTRRSLGSGFVTGIKRFSTIRNPKSDCFQHFPFVLSTYLDVKKKSESTQLDCLRCQTLTYPHLDTTFTRRRWPRCPPCPSNSSWPCWGILWRGITLRNLLNKRPISNHVLLENFFSYSELHPPCKNM